VNRIQLALIISYLVTTCYFFFSYLEFSWRHPCSSLEDNFLSVVIFVIAIAFWPLLLPVSLLKIFRMQEFSTSTVVPVVVAMSAFGFVFCII
jgi:hypothetical protein